MGAEASAVQYSGNGGRKRYAGVSGAVTFSLSAGALATLAAALASLLVDSVLVKRMLWVAVAVAVAVGAGVWRAGCAAMTSPDSDRRPQGSRTSSPG